MNINQLLTQDCTLCAVSISSKKRLIEIISHTAAEILQDIPEQDILDALLHRERLGSTGIGNGIALPHGRLLNTDKTIAIFLTTDEPINFDAIDNKPVSIFFALLVPDNECNNHLKSLAAVAEKLSDKAVLKKIKSAQNSTELYQAITE
ncbi:PTS IIA-like nitrogen regulatory protein PtsN [Catenovulum maritimum]|uniref:PTS sugar transporter n=1 Tax=Catenovulum maritimum TaxID=1513271 RepID=A0A0J8GQM8_9ALTE|nr:PTS IIA-like nitrogen regulatory protein PtsN [Catenovulum maritimum]KMT65017.1 PTS sugar transporter [Catenovulum maritimum]